jgi:acetoin utilization deacetylase AcuC-like enzyme
MKTGVFFHPTFSGKEWIVIGNKWKNFPEVMQPALDLPQVEMCPSEKVDEELLLKIHTHRFVEDLKQAWYCEGAYRSVGGCVEATEKMLAGEMTNALVFTVAAGHHAERDFAAGGTYASCAGPAFYNARKKLGPKRFAILDTDRHHGNGTRDVFQDDKEVLHVCFCDMDVIVGDGTKICVNTGWQMSDEEYLDRVRKEFIPRAETFRPDMIFHNFGHDTSRGDYGDIGLNPDFFLRLTREMKDFAEKVCGGRYLVLTHGGNRADVAEYIFPAILNILAEED